MLAAVSKNFLLPLGPTEVQAKAFEESLLFACDIGVQEIILEGDSLGVANCIAGKSSPPSSVASVLYGIISLSHDFCSFQVSHKRRNGNKLAHLLAKHAQNFEH